VSVKSLPLRTIDIAGKPTSGLATLVDTDGAVGSARLAEGLIVGIVSCPEFVVPLSQPQPISASSNGMARNAHSQPALGLRR